MENEVPPPPAPPTSRLGKLFAEYGPWAIGIYLVLFGAVLAVYFISSLWWRPAGDGGFFALILGSWIAAKATQIPRIAATLALTPLVARLFGRAPGKPPV